MHPLIQAHREELLALARRRGVTRLRVFGSMARGDADESSDVDFLVSLPAKVSGLALGGLLMDVRDLLGRNVDIVTEAALPRGMRESVLASAIEL